MATKKHENLRTHENETQQHKHNDDDAQRNPSPSTASQFFEDGEAPKMNHKQYEQEMRLLHGEL